jgi:lycopene beta-cyclase
MLVSHPGKMPQLSTQKILAIDQQETYDYMITGMGCAGLSLAVHMQRAGLLNDKTLLMIDRDPKSVNDRTWCFWETGTGPFESVVSHRWDSAWFHAEGYSGRKELSPYAYKMIRGIDYYNHCLSSLRGDPNITILHAPVDSIHQDGTKALVHAEGRIYHASWLFNSILFGDLRPDPGDHMLLQHFKGWIIRLPEDKFDPGEATLMDFRPDQGHGTTFVYVMPFDKRTALVEYTLFTSALLEKSAYDEGLRTYISKELGALQYEILDEEFGVIPMTTAQFPPSEGRIVHIGTAGGQTKASSGYTFTFIQRHAERMVKSLRETGRPPGRERLSDSRFKWYDSVLLNILAKNILPGWFVFRELFRHNPTPSIFRFLDNGTGLAEEIRIMNTLPRWPFMRAGLTELWHMYRRNRNTKRPGA